MILQFWKIFHLSQLSQNVSENLKSTILQFWKFFHLSQLSQNVIEDHNSLILQFEYCFICHNFPKMLVKIKKNDSSILKFLICPSCPKILVKMRKVRFFNFEIFHLSQLSQNVSENQKSTILQFWIFSSVPTFPKC